MTPLGLWCSNLSNLLSNTAQMADVTLNIALPVTCLSDECMREIKAKVADAWYKKMNVIFKQKDGETCHVS